MSDLVEHPVRFARAGDLRKLAGIQQAADPMYAAHLGEDRMIDALRFPAPTGAQRQAVPGFLLVAGSAVAGFAHVIVLDGSAHLEQVSVRPEQMRRGIGGALVRATMRQAEVQGFEAMSLCTYRDVPWNAPFYAAFGFVEVTDLLPFQRRLREVEQDLGLDAAGTRVVMSVPLAPTRPRPRPVVVETVPVNPFAVLPIEPGPDDQPGRDPAHGDPLADPGVTRE
ncbi:MAG: GNAT family N-acetyltransferase [Nocardioides sp.]|nr:GNAT family N-acetyltransferase [Nocardioides sp.]